MISICRRRLLPDGSTTCRPRSLEPTAIIKSVFVSINILCTISVYIYTTNKNKQHLHDPARKETKQDTMNEDMKKLNMKPLYTYSIASRRRNLMWIQYDLVHNRKQIQNPCRNLPWVNTVHMFILNFLIVSIDLHSHNISNMSREYWPMWAIFTLWYHLEMPNTQRPFDVRYIVSWSLLYPQSISGPCYPRRLQKRYIIYIFILGKKIYDFNCELKFLTRTNWYTENNVYIFI